MGWFSNIVSAPLKLVTEPIKAAGNLLGGGSSGGSQTSNTTTSTSVNPTTNVTTTIDTEPIAEILAQSNEQTAKTAKETAKIQLLNAERDRQLEAAKFKKIDTYLEHAKNGLVLSAVVAGLIYVSKKGKRK